jgi:hypothetical protein
MAASFVPSVGLQQAFMSVCNVATNSHCRASPVRCALHAFMRRICTFSLKQRDASGARVQTTSLNDQIDQFWGVES